ncbi:MAG: YceI family protein [Acetobacteraceae bacterium]|nr:YceI family protein [Acetobacteraceae bacterium]MCX7684448.1 YceI family protein [Acetobacteraceae bacterium]MDW8398979.1 YceI family protein [Acetobacteraceae bacterium]
MDAQASRLFFEATEAGRPVRGEFRRFEADIAFDPDRPETARVEVRIATLSAETGRPMHDQALQDADWFAPARFPEARFSLSGARRMPDGSYLGEGSVTLRGRTQPVRLSFRLSIEGEVARMRGEAVLDRLAFGIGERTDRSAGWIGREVRVEVQLLARRETPAAP